MNHFGIKFIRILITIFILTNSIGAIAESSNIKIESCTNKCNKIWGAATISCGVIAIFTFGIGGVVCLSGFPGYNQCKNNCSNNNETTWQFDNKKLNNMKNSLVMYN